jgi:large subunit ribosomal protein L6
MSRLAKQPVEIPKGVEVTASSDALTIKGPKGTLTHKTHPLITITVENGTIAFAKAKETNEAKALIGTQAALVKSAIEGVTNGYTRVLEIEGVGYRAEVQGAKMNFSLGFSHPVSLAIPAGITATTEKSVITISGIDKHAVGQFAANVRGLKEPEPYKGKGIRYKGEYIIRKQGKKAV